MELFAGDDIAADCAQTQSEGLQNADTKDVRRRGKRENDGGLEANILFQRRDDLQECGRQGM